MIIRSFILTVHLRLVPELQGETMNQVISGMIVMGYFVAGLFFLRFWADTRDRLFVLFALSFGILGLQRIVLSLTTQSSEDAVYLYAVRLLAFVIILLAIIDKNRSRRKK
jgi:hypothetical protein